MFKYLLLTTSLLIIIPTQGSDRSSKTNQDIINSVVTHYCQGNIAFLEAGLQAEDVDMLKFIEAYKKNDTHITAPVIAEIRAIVGSEPSTR